MPRGVITEEMISAFGGRRPYAPEEVAEPPVEPIPEPVRDFGATIPDLLSALGIGTLGFLMTGVEQTFHSIGAMLTAPWRAKELGELAEEFPIVSFLPGGRGYKQYLEWKGSPEEPETVIPFPSFRQMGAWLKPYLRNDYLLKALGIDVSEWEETDKFEWGRLGMGDLAELTPFILFGGGAPKTALEQSLKLATRNIAKGKAPEEAINLAFDWVAKKGKMPKFKISAEVPPVVVKPKVKPPIKPKIEPPVKPPEVPAVPKVKEIQIPKAPEGETVSSEIVTEINLMTREEFIGKNAGLVVKERGRWGTIHYALKTRKADYQKAGQIVGDTVEGTLGKLYDRFIGVKPPAVPPVKPVVKPPVPVVKLPPELVVRRTELQEMLAKPSTELPKGVKKIELRQELKSVSAKLVPQEKALRQKIMAQVKTLDLPQSQYREIFREKGGSRWLSQVNMERLPRVLEAVRTARPVSIKGKKVITLKTEQGVLARKGELIDEGILTEETYKDILGSLKLSTDRYVSRAIFITQSEARSIIREMNNRAILAPLGELKFAKPTAVKYLTSDIYYGQVLGVHPLVAPLELAKVDFDLAYRAMSRAIGKQISGVNRAFRVSVAERALAKAEGRPTTGVAKLRNLLDKFEEAPAGLTKQQKAEFDWFRNLNRTIISGENEVRRGLGMPEIAYREAYVRHVPDTMAEEILRGLHPLPPSLSYWSSRIVGKKIFNPMEFHRRLSNDLAKLYTEDLELAARNMVYTGLKEIHLAQPLKTFTVRMGALSDVMPASTRKWVVDFVNQRIKGQQTEWDAGLNRLVTESGFGGLMNDVLRPYRLSLGTQPVSRVASTIGNATILAVLGLPRPRLARLLIRNLFQRTQELALHNPIAVLKGFAFEKGKLKELIDKSRFLKSYTGVEEWPAELMGKLVKVPLAPYQATAVINARQAMRVTYYDTLSFFTKSKYKNLGWASPKRTYKEAKSFLYPEEETLMIAEMELAARATQYQYIGLGMPGIFRNKTLIPLTRLQSWWMNHFFMFHREAAHRLLYGETRLGHKLPWSKRVNYLTYLLVGGGILTSMGYEMSYLWQVIPHNLSPVGQFMTGLLTYVSADKDWQREKGKKEIFSAWKAMVPGPLAYDEFTKLWSGEMPLWQMFFYGREEEEAPPRLPTWGIINREPALNMKVAKQDIGEAMGQLGQTFELELPDPYFTFDIETGQWLKHTFIKPETYVYDMNDLGVAIRRATLKLEDKDITEENEFSPLTLMYKQAELHWDTYYYSLPASARTEFREQPTDLSAQVEAYLFFWGRLTVLRNPFSLEIVQKMVADYGIPPEAIPALAEQIKPEPKKPTEPEALPGELFTEEAIGAFGK